MSVRTKVEITVYKKNDVNALHTEPPLTIESDGVWGERVVLVVGGDRYTVVANDLELAVRKARGK